MSALSETSPTLLDLAKRMTPDGSVASIIEILDLQNEMIQDIPFLECNDGSRHLTTIRTGIPAPTWRKLYGAVQPTKSTTAQVADGTGNMEAYAEVDKRLADQNGNTAAFRLSENLPQIEGMNQEFSSTFWYGNDASEPEAFTGLSPRFNSLSAANGQNIITGGGDTGLTSIWLIGWGPRSVHGLYPKGIPAGLQMSDKGQQTKETSSGNYEIYRSHYQWNCGISVRDWRYIVRIPNIKVSTLTKDASAGTDLPDVMSQALELIQEEGTVQARFYMNRTVRSFLRRQCTAKISDSTLTWEMVGGKRVMYFGEVPVRRSDSLVNTESAVA